MAKISIIVPIRGDDTNIRVCLNSILSQSFNDFEVICLFQKKTDIISHYIAIDNRVKFLATDIYNSSITSINNAVKESTGDYIMFVDSINQLKENALLGLHIEISNNADMVFFNSINDNSIYNYCSAIPVNNINRNSEIDSYEHGIKRLLSLDLYFSSSSFIVKKTLYSMIKLEDADTEYFISYLIAARLLYHSKKTICLAKAYLTRIKKIKNRKNNKTSLIKKEEKIINDIAYVNNMFYNFLREIGLYKKLEKEIEYYEYISMSILYYRIKRYKLSISDDFFYSAFIHSKKYTDIVTSVENTLKNKNEVDISIIIPVYNTEIYLNKCIDSIINQSFKNLEIIIVDDYSSGNCKEIIESYNNKKIKYIRNESNMGSAWSRIYGLKEARGKYIHFVDSDDYLSGDSYKKIIDYLGNKYEAIYFNNYIVYDDKTTINYQNIDNGNLTGKRAAFDDMFFNPSEQSRTLWSRVFLREHCIEAVKYMPKYSISMAEDWIFTLFILFHVRKCRKVHDALYYYNKSNPEAITSLSMKESSGSITRIEKLITQYSIACNSLVLFLIVSGMWRNYRANWSVYISIDLKYHFIDMFNTFEENILQSRKNENIVASEFRKFLECRIKPSYVLSFIKHNVYLSNGLSCQKNTKYSFDNMFYMFFSNLFRLNSFIKFIFSRVESERKTCIKIFGFQITLLKRE